MKCINSIINCNIVPYSYFPHVLSLHILYIQLQTVKCINCIINCNIVPYSYFPHVLSLNILYIQLQIVKFINYIIKSNTVLHSYFSHILLLPFLYKLTNKVWKWKWTVSIPKTHTTFCTQCTIHRIKKIFMQVFNCPIILVQFSHNMLGLTKHATCV